MGTRTQSTKSNRTMEAYIVMLHLVSQKRANFTDIRDLLFWTEWKQSEAGRIVGHINRKIDQLSIEWKENIPHINAFVFDRNGLCSTWICENIFEKNKNEQPTPKQIAEYAAAIAAYEKWDKVLEEFRKEAFKPPEH